MELSPTTETSIRQIHSQLEQLKTILCERVTFTTIEVAAKLGLDERTISDYCRTGAIASVQPRKRGPYLIPLAEVEHLLNQAHENKRLQKKLSSKALNKIN